MAENISKRRVFKKSFLKSISCACTLEDASWSEVTKKVIADLLCADGFTLIDSGALPMAQAKKNTMSILVSRQMLIITTDVKDYISFEHFLDTIIVLSVKLLHAMSCTVIKALLFQKMNQYNIHSQRTGQKVTEDKLFKLLFSDEMLANLPIRITKESEKKMLFSQTAFKEEEGADQASALLTVGAVLTEGIKVNEWIDRMTELNEALFTLWTEATSETIRNVMKQEKN